MSELLVYIIIFALYAATVAFLFVMLFIHDFRSWWLRGATAVLGLGALAMPALLARDTLGYPDPWPEPGRYELLGWDVDEGADALYLFVMRPGETAPYHLRVPFDLNAALALQKAADEIGTFKEMSVEVLPEGADAGPGYALTLEKVFGEE